MTGGWRRQLIYFSALTAPSPSRHLFPNCHLHSELTAERLCETPELIDGVFWSVNRELVLLLRSSFDGTTSNCCTMFKLDAVCRVWIRVNGPVRSGERTQLAFISNIPSPLHTFCGLPVPCRLCCPDWHTPLTFARLKHIISPPALDGCLDYIADLYNHYVLQKLEI
jgi:hypothetical protein